MKKNKILDRYFQKEIDLFEERLRNMKFQKDRDYKNVDVVFKGIIEDVWQDD